MTSSVALPDAMLPLNGELLPGAESCDGESCGASGVDMVVLPELVAPARPPGMGAAPSCAATGIENARLQHIAATSAGRTQDGSADKTCIGLGLLTSTMRWRRCALCFRAFSASRYGAGPLQHLGSTQRRTH